MTQKVFATTQQALSWIESQTEPMVEEISQWAEINTHVSNIAGLDNLRHKLFKRFELLEPDTLIDKPLAPAIVINERGEQKEMPLAPGLFAAKRREAPLQILFVIHMDTVFPPNSPFQRVDHAEKTLHGPGVADAKAGISIIGKVLEAWEASTGREQLGWGVFLNTDEELGSPGSTAILYELAPQYHWGLIFEPATPDGNLIGNRKGSGNFTAVLTGKSAHAGRAFYQGQSALHQAAHLISYLDQYNTPTSGITINVGEIQGGGPSNVVQDLAIIRFNIRVTTSKKQQQMEHTLKKLEQEYNQIENLSLKIYGTFSSPPKPLVSGHLYLMKRVLQSAKELNISLSYADSGGVCDGNKLGTAGLANVDTLGVVGSGIHSHDEFLWIDSLTQRTKLTFKLLNNLCITMPS